MAPRYSGTWGELQMANGGWKAIRPWHTVLAEALLLSKTPPLPQPCC